jgi:type I restriction enzyme S subunit
MNAVEGWKIKRLQQLATINYGKSAASILADDGEYPVLGTGGAERMGNDYLYDGCSIILGRKGTIDRVYFASGKFWTIDTAYYLSDFEEALPRWLFYFLQTLDLRQMNEATGVPSLSRESLYKIKVLTPPENEQAKISEILSTVDKAIEHTDALIAKQQRIKTGLMRDLLARGIDEHGRLRFERSHKFKHSPLGRIPVEWGFSRLESIGRWASGGTPSKANPSYWGDEVHWLCPKDMKTFDIDSTIDRLTLAGARHGSRLMPEKTVFIVVRGMILAHTFPVCIANRPMAFNQDVKAIAAGPAVEARFLAYWLVSQADNFLKLTTTATHGTRRFDMKELFDVVIPIPEKEEQTRVVTRLDAAEEQMDSNRKIVRKLRSLKTGLMQDLLTGRKRVTALLEPEPKREKIYARH